MFPVASGPKAMEEQAEAEAEKRRQGEWIREKAERAQEMLKVSANALSCVTRLILTLVRYRFGLDAENFALLQSYFALSCMDADDESGWEETVDAAMTHLLKTSLAKTAKESSATRRTAGTR